jgi:Fic family protein
MMKVSNSYHNTTNQTKDYVEKRTKKNKSQEQLVLEIFEQYKKLTASQVYAIFPKNVPLTSIRRAISNLQYEQKLEKLEETITGIYDAPEHFYKLVIFKV